MLTRSGYMVDVDGAAISWWTLTAHRFHGTWIKQNGVVIWFHPKITTLLFVSLKQMSYLRDIMKKTSNNQPIITRFSKSTLCLFVMIFCPSTQGWKHCQPLRIF